VLKAGLVLEARVLGSSSCRSLSLQHNSKTPHFHILAGHTHLSDLFTPVAYDRRSHSLIHIPSACRRAWHTLFNPQRCARTQYHISQTHLSSATESHAAS
jgi:hypothetical protein